MEPPKWDAATRSKMEKLQLEIEQSQYTVNIIQQQVTLLKEVKKSIQDAINICKELETRKPGEEILVPIGGSVHLLCELKETNKLFVNLGSGITSNMKRDDALTILRTRMSQIDNSIQRLTQQQANLSMAIDQKEQQLISLSGMLK